MIRNFRWTLAAALACAAMAQAGAGETGIYFNSEQGDYIGQGLEQRWTPEDGVFTAKKNSDNGVSISYDGGPVWWSLDFAAPNEELLTPGDYVEATRWPFQSPVKPGLSVGGSGRGCNESYGTFTVTEVTYGEGDEVLVFAAEFEQHCEQQDGSALFGNVLFNAENATLPDIGSGTGAGTDAGLAPAFDASAVSGGGGTVSVSISLYVSPNHAGRRGKVFVAAVLGSDLFLHDGTGWKLYTGGTLPAYKTGPLVSASIDVIKDVDPVSLAGVSVYVGYGVSDVEMLNTGRYGKVYTF